MSVSNPPGTGAGRLIQSGTLVRFGQFNKSIQGAHFLGGILFLMNTVFDPIYFEGMDRLTFFRNPHGNQVVLRQHERLEHYRVIYYPPGFFLNLVDHLVNSVRGVVLQIDVLTLDRPKTSDLMWGGVSKSGQDIWCTDVILTGIDMSNQIWMRHCPVQYLRSGVEVCERWLFGMKDGDVMVSES